MTTDPAMAGTSATMTIWRVFGLNDKYSDQPEPYWATNAPVKSSSTDSIVVMIGEVPGELLTILRQWRAQIRGQLSILTGTLTAPEQRLEMFHEDIKNVQLAEFEKPYASWLTVCVKRSIELQLPEQGEFDWGPNTEAIAHAMLTFTEQGNTMLDVAAASVIGSSEGLAIGHLRFAQRRPYLAAPGKAAITIPNPQLNIQHSGIRIDRRARWGAAAPTAKIAAAISTVASTAISPQITRLIAQPMAWLGSAMNEEEDDLRRFTYAFGGLELLATQAEKTSRRDLIGLVDDIDENLPTAELLWPTTGEDFVWRNLVFRFAAMAAVYSPDTAKQDVASFRNIAKARNNMFHGSEQTVTREISVSCTELLRKYLGLVATRPQSA